MKDIEEFKKEAEKRGYVLSDEEAEAYIDKVDFAKQEVSGELTDDELAAVSGGCTKWRKGRAYSGDWHHWLITTVGNSCSLYKYNEGARGLKKTCKTCANVLLAADPFDQTYCEARSYDYDPLNPKD